MVEYLNAQRCPLASPVIPISPDPLVFHHHACTVPCCRGNPTARPLSGYTGTPVLAPEQLKEDSLRLQRKRYTLVLVAASPVRHWHNSETNKAFTNIDLAVYCAAYAA